MKKIATIFLSLLLFGCATPVKQFPIIPVHSETDTFKPGVIQKKMIGEIMLEKTSMIITPGFIALSDWGLPLVRKDSIWKCNSKLGNGDFVCLEEGRVWTLVIKPSGDLAGGLSVGLNYGSFVKFDQKIPPGLFRPTDMPLKGSIRQELLYNGRTRDTIKIAYREFKDDMARPAFYQDLNYDLSESRIIGFRDIKIEVIEATNTDIKFMVKN